MQKTEQMSENRLRLSRRALQQRVPAIALLGLSPARLFSPLALAQKETAAPQASPSPANLSPADDQFLDDIEKPLGVTARRIMFCTMARCRP